VTNNEDPAARLKGDALEDLVEDFIRDLQKLLRQHNLPCLYVKSPHYPGQGRANIDFFLLFRGRNKTRYCFYIDPKNFDRTMKNTSQIEEKINKKFDRENDFKKPEENSKNVGMIVGNFMMKSDDIEELKCKNIHYLELGELGTYSRIDGTGKFYLDEDEKIYYDFIMRGRMMQFLAIHTEGVFEIFSSNNSLEIKDENNFSIIDENGQCMNYNIEPFHKIEYLPVNATNMMDFLTLEKGLRGRITIISPWKGFSNNPKIHITSISYGTTLYKTQWGRKRK